MIFYNILFVVLLLVTVALALKNIETVKNVIGLENDEHKLNGFEFSLETENNTDPYKINLLSLRIANTRVFSNKIIDGIKAPKMTFYYQVAIYIYSKDDTILFCGGSLISNNYILTAAHCINRPIHKILVILGNNDLWAPDPNEVRTYVKKFYVHFKFNADTLKNDICLLELSKPVTFNDAIGPINLPKYSDDGQNFIDKIGIVSGFGKIQDYGDSTNHLMYLRVRVMGNFVCNHIYYDKEADSTNICTSGYGHIGACHGDSGGPLVIDDKLMGIVSFGADECTLGYPSVYTRVSAYLKWISRYAGVEISE